MEKDISVSYEPNHIYHGWPEPSASHVKKLADGPIAYKQQYIDSTFKETEAMRYGTLLHTWGEMYVAHGKDSFWDLHECADKKQCTAAGSLNTHGKTKAEELLDETKILLGWGDYEKLKKQTEQILCNSASKELLDESVDVEFNVRFPIGDHRMRCRCDGATNEFWYDIKTTRERNPITHFHYAVRDFHYDIQEAIYGHASQLMGWEPHSMRFIVTSTTGQHRCEVMTLPKQMVQIAYDRTLELLDELQARREADYWLPETYGYTHEIKYYEGGLF